MTVSFGTRSQVASGSAQGTVALCKLDSTHLVVVYSDGSSNVYAAIATISGTTVSSIGTATKMFQQAGGYAYVNGVKLLDSTHFVVVGRDGNSSPECFAVVGSISGTTITAGSSVQVGPAPTQDSWPCVVTVLDSTHFAMAFADGSANFYISTQVGSVSGTTITLGSAVQLEAVSNGGMNRDIITLDSTHYVIVYRDTSNSNRMRGVVCSVSGTTVTVNTAATITSNSVGSSDYSKRPISAATVDSTHFVVAYLDVTNSNKMYAIACSISGTTISPGTAVNLTTNTPDTLRAAYFGSGKFVVAFVDASDSSKGKVIPASVSGTTITATLDNTTTFESGAVQFFWGTNTIDTTNGNLAAIIYPTGSSPYTSYLIIGDMGFIAPPNGNFLGFM